MYIIIDSEEIRSLATEIQGFMELTDYTIEEVEEAVYRCLRHKIECAKEELFNGGYRSVKSFLETQPVKGGEA